MQTELTRRGFLAQAGGAALLPVIGKNVPASDEPDPNRVKEKNGEVLTLNYATRAITSSLSASPQSVIAPPAEG